jgi:Ser/Thr protein kinase RdoA (MazF antagonist)
MLDLDRVAPLLIELGLIGALDVVEGELTIVQADRRNRHFRVEVRDGAGWFLKQPVDPAEGGHESLRCEAAFLEFCREEPRAAAVLPTLPHLVRRESGEDLLIYDLIVDAAPLDSLLEEEGEAAVAAARLGTALGTLHRAFDGIDPDDPRLAGWLPRSVPFGLRIHEPGLGQLAHNSPAIHEALRIVQEGGVLGGHLDRLRRDWRPSTLIHGDIRFANVLARGAPDPGLWLVDWEMAQHGDPAWDLAGALQDFLVAWSASMPMTAGLTAAERAAGARIPLSSVWPAIAALWGGYRRAAGTGPAEAADLLRRAVGLSGARLLQSAYEASDNAEALTGHSVLLLQVAANVLADPDRGQVRLYGLPPLLPAA